MAGGATPAVALGLGFTALIRRTTPFRRHLLHPRPILSRILSGRMTNTILKKIVYIIEVNIENFHLEKIFVNYDLSRGDFIILPPTA
jgi:hypothetical protein